jgi:hypothetical protein
MGRILENGGFAFGSIDMEGQNHAAEIRFLQRHNSEYIRCKLTPHSRVLENLTVSLLVFVKPVDVYVMK